MTNSEPLPLGNSFVSAAVKDLAASSAFRRRLEHPPEWRRHQHPGDPAPPPLGGIEPLTAADESTPAPHPERAQ